jgi:hypothetical protein
MKRKLVALIVSGGILLSGLGVALATPASARGHCPFSVDPLPQHQCGLRAK